MHNPYFQNTSPYAPQGSYDLPPVQSVTSPSSFHYPPAISAPPNPSSHTQAHTSHSQTHPHTHPHTQAHPHPHPPATTPSSSTSTSSNGLPMAHLLQPVSPQHLQQQAPPYSRSYASSSGSPAEPTAVLPEHTTATTNTTTPAGSISGTSGFSALGQAGQGQSHSHSQQTGSAAAAAAAGLQQKRAYRQRRKDPSCDACRERKVKCDASESSSCTECNNRKVRCQFTKETNRRMSSIKQVQDLEKQLLSTKQQLHQLRSGTLKPESSFMDLDFIDATSATGQPGFKLPDIGSRAARRQQPQLQTPAQPVSIDSSVRTNLRTYSQGIWKPPNINTNTNTHARTSTSLGVDAPPLPPKPIADGLLSQYHAYVHSMLPIVHWPDFLAEYEQVFRTGSLHGAPRDWTAVLFGVLACGALHTHNHRQDEYNAPNLLRVACNALDMGQDDFCIDRVQAALLISIGLYEGNSKSACWVWIGAAVRIAQELGLHVESGSSLLDSELRRRVWWGVYTWDRLLALDMGKPALINDEDCEVDFPTTEDNDTETAAAAAGGGQGQPAQISTIQVMRSVSHLARTLRSPTIPAPTIDSFERHFETCLASIPTPYHPNYTSMDHAMMMNIDPRFLAPVIHLQNVRLLLYRHNLSPLSPIDARAAAFDACLGITLDTASLVSRCMHAPAAFASAASASLCMHIWRCTLLLLVRQQYAAALACVHASALIGNLRVVNTACGRYLAFFVRCVLDRLSSPGPSPGPGSGPDLSRDEELVAYAVGDSHASFDSWVWSGDGPQSPSTSPSISGPSPGPGPGPGPGLGSGESDWEGWEWIERTVRHLLVEQQQQQQQRPESSTHELARPNESTFKSPASTGEDRSSSSSHSRMTIASII